MSGTLKSTGEVFDLRTTRAHWKCRVCETVQPPQMCVAIFEPHAGSYRVKAWECLHHEEDRQNERKD